ncbi:hypothetical protein SAMD00019534_088140 [Acytostelium subglobosum LB1]|uniref:hypothetical protein n=1 Tax=Acytostelium subglobosum LB1 TaxID=1410327 RepID=UPI000644B3F8|nr:hypothetical protein SAMD00019534_088140 [Acytostelium subglobosum LB1]GAM25639.1 hypothetical protein SAMD00019534_088140 [Acytostelium subglobosum LB1]|eukprot:XP_012751625.1 hypothetical protein SAMD00019534_088140 [Acytostelium subglobosum LB1]
MNQQTSTSLTSQPTTLINNGAWRSPVDKYMTPRGSIKSTIKGGKLMANGNLHEMLRYKATQMFLQTFDSVAKDYPPNQTLLSYAAKYNNTTVFKHLINHPNMSMNIDEMPSFICQHGNVDMLQAYLKATDHHPWPWPIKGVRLIPQAIDAGNVEFVRLLLKQLNLDHCFNDPNAMLSSVQLNNRGVSVEMLKLLHEDYRCLFRLTRLWHAALLHSTRCNMVDSVQYIIDNMPTPAEGYGDSGSLLPRCLRHCAKVGNITMFRVFVSAHAGARYIWLNDLRLMISKALNNGQAEFIKYLYDHHVGNDSVTTQSETAILSCLELDNGDIKLRFTPLSAIRSGDIANVEALSGKQVISLPKKVCLRMSREMAEFISSPRATQLTFRDSSILNMIEAVGKPGSNITAAIICDFIANCTHWQPSLLDTAMRNAAGLSANMMKILRSKLDVTPQQNYRYEVVSALDNGCRETMELLFEHLTTRQQLDHYQIKTSAFSFISKRSLDDVKYLLKHMESLRKDPHIFIRGLNNPNPGLFEYLIDSITCKYLDDRCLNDIIDCSLAVDKPYIIDTLQQLENKVSLNPPKDTLCEMIEYH